MPRYEVKFDIFSVKHITAIIQAPTAKEAIELAQDGAYDESDEDTAPVDTIDIDNFRTRKLR